ncbi:sensor histidine kinase [Leucothrix pacifica]|uniref:sensor histidine kinase n=1 Tax=Leucothrix pacifica TaxID=1247513 RepID=UPI00319DB7AE
MGGLRYEYASLDLEACVQEVVTANLTAAEKSDINLSFEQSQPLMIDADQQRICQLISNLLRNSLAYTNDGGVITVKLKRQGDEAVLTIHDTPPGVTQEECDQLFEPLFRQDSSRNRRSAGAVLGLAICRNIVEAHRGNIAPLPYCRISTPALLMRSAWNQHLWNSVCCTPWCRVRAGCFHVIV